MTAFICMFTGSRTTNNFHIKKLKGLISLFLLAAHWCWIDGRAPRIAGTAWPCVDTAEIAAAGGKSAFGRNACKSPGDSFKSLMS